MSWRTRCAMCFMAIVTCISPLRAEDTIFTVPIRANYDFNLLGGTSLNPPPNSPKRSRRALRSRSKS